MPMGSCALLSFNMWFIPNHQMSVSHQNPPHMKPALLPEAPNFLGLRCLLQWLWRPQRHQLPDTEHYFATSLLPCRFTLTFQRPFLNLTISKPVMLGIKSAFSRSQIPLKKYIGDHGDNKRNNFLDGLSSKKSHLRKGRNHFPSSP